MCTLRAGSLLNALKSLIALYTLGSRSVRESRKSSLILRFNLEELEELMCVFCTLRAGSLLEALSMICILGSRPVRELADRSCNTLKEVIGAAHNDVKGLQKDVKWLRNNVKGLNSNVKGMRSHIRGLWSNVNGIRNDINALKKGQESLNDKMDKLLGHRR